MSQTISNERKKNKRRDRRKAYNEQQSRVLPKFFTKHEGINPVNLDSP